MKVYIFTEGSETSGFGHLTRSKAIGEAFRERGLQVHFIVNASPEVADVLKDENVDLQQWQESRIYPDDLNESISVFDSYKASPCVYSEVANLAAYCVYFDDYKRIDYPPGTIINSALFANKEMYSEKAHTLLGLKYHVMRKEFWDLELADKQNKAKNILITFGGTEDAFAISVAKSIRDENSDVNIQVVLGKNKSENSFDSRITFKEKLSAEEMCQSITQADIVLSGGGQTVYELARVGVLAVIVSVADNQVANAREWHNKGFALYAGDARDTAIRDSVANAIDVLLNSEGQEERKRKGRYLVDGQGARRVVDEVLKKVRGL